MPLDSKLIQKILHSYYSGHASVDNHGIRSIDPTDARIIKALTRFCDGEKQRSEYTSP